MLQSNGVAVYNGWSLTAPHLLQLTNSFLPNDGVWFSRATLTFTAAGPFTTLMFNRCELTSLLALDCNPPDGSAPADATVLNSQNISLLRAQSGKPPQIALYSFEIL